MRALLCSSWCERLCNSKNTGSGIYLHSKNLGRRGLYRIKSPRHICEASRRTKAKINLNKRNRNMSEYREMHASQTVKVLSWPLNISLETYLLKKMLFSLSLFGSVLLLIVLLLVLTIIFNPCVVGNVRVFLIESGGRIRFGLISPRKIPDGPSWTCMCVSTCVCVCVSVCVCIVSPYLCVCVCLSTSVCVFLWLCVSLHVCMYMLVSVCVSMSVCVCVYAGTQHCQAKPSFSVMLPFSSSRNHFALLLKQREPLSHKLKTRKPEELK